MFWNISFRITVTIFPRQFWFCKFLFSLFFILLVNVSRAHQTSVISTGSNLDSCLFSTFLFQLPLRAPFYRTFLPHLLVAVSSCSFSLHDFFSPFPSYFAFYQFLFDFSLCLIFHFFLFSDVFFSFSYLWFYQFCFFLFSFFSFVFILSSYFPFSTLDFLFYFFTHDLSLFHSCFFFLFSFLFFLVLIFSLFSISLFFFYF